MDIYELFKLIKNQKYDEFKKALIDIKVNKEEMSIDLNLCDDNNQYLLNYIVVANKIDLLDLMFQFDNIKIDIFDTDNKTLLYIPIKYNYIDLINTILEYDKKTISVSICNVRDAKGNTSLHYAIKNKNLEIVRKLIQAGSNPLFENINSMNALHFAVYSREYDVIKFILASIDNEKKINILVNSRISTGETALHFACNLQEIKIIQLLLDYGANPNIVSMSQEASILQYAVNLGNRKIVEILMKTNNININHQDIHGNTALHYCVIENNGDIFDLLTKNDNINVNLWNMNGEIPLHICIEKGNNLKREIIDFLIVKSNLNIQNNDYDSCLHLICKYDIWENYKNILENKNLDILVINKSNKRPIDYLDKNKNKYNDFINIVVESYISRLRSNKNVLWNEKWENICKQNDEDMSDDDKKELDQTNKKKIDIPLDKCRGIVREKINGLINKSTYYVDDKCKTKSYPVKKEKLCITIDDTLNIDTKRLQFCTFTGSTLDILIGLIFLLKQHKNATSPISQNIQKNEQLCKAYERQGYVMKNNCEFLNFEIVFMNNRIYFTESFEMLLQKSIANEMKRFIIIPIGIDTFQGAHANYLIIDKQTHEIERFEPHGSTNPSGFNYNSKLFDNILEVKIGDIYMEIMKIKLKYFSPNTYLPKIGLQIFDIKEKTKKKIGDPMGFCAVWSIYYTDMRLRYPDIGRNKIIKYIIKTIKEQRISYRNLIRNYAFNIIELRDSILNNVSVDINDWLNDEITTEQHDIIITKINDMINRV